MLAIARKKLLETSRNRMFWLFTVLFSLLFPGMVTLTYKLQAGDGGSDQALSFSSSMDPSVLPDGPLRVTIVGDPPARLLKNEKLTLERFASVAAASEAAVARVQPGFPWPFAFGYSFEGDNVVLLLPNKDGKNTDPSLVAAGGVAPSANQSVDAVSYLAASLLLDPFNVRLESYPAPSTDAFIANLVFSLYGPLLYVFGSVFIIPALLQMVVKDKHAKRYFERMGLSKLQYWLGNYMVDVVVVTLLSAVGAVIVLAAQVTPLSSHAGLFVLALVLFNISAPILGYCASFIFSNEETAQKWAFAVFSMAFVVCSLPAIITGAIGASEAVQRYASLLPCALYPPSALSRILTLIAVGADSDDLKIAFPLLVWDLALWVFVLFCLEGGLKRRKRPSLRDRLVEAEENALAIDLKDVHVSYKTRKCCYVARKKAVNGVSLAIQSGEIYSLLGANGAGKTSLISVIAGEIEAQENGVVRLLGMDVSDVRISQQCSFVPQFDISLDLLTANELLAVVAAIRAVNVSASVPLLQELDLTEAASQRLTQLSGGQRRKVSLVAALMSRPKVLILDEPTAGIDVGSRRQVHRLLVEHSKNGGTVLFSSHSMDEVLEIATRVGMLVKGRIEAQGTVTELLNRYANGYLVRIHHESDGSELLAQLRSKVSGVEVELNVGSALHVMVDSASTSLGQLFRVLQQMQAENASIRYTCSHGTLQNAFVKFVELQARAEQA